VHIPNVADDLHKTAGIVEDTVDTDACFGRQVLVQGKFGKADDAAHQPLHLREFPHTFAMVFHAVIPFRYLIVLPLKQASPPFLAK
jgi:hypothetical protein